MEKLSNTKDELKKALLIKSVYIFIDDMFSVLPEGKLNRVHLSVFLKKDHFSGDKSLAM